MKQLCIACILLCTSVITFAQWARDKENVKQVTDKRTVANFHSIKSKGDWDVRIVYGKSNDIEIVGDEDIVPKIITTVEEGVLTITTKNSMDYRTKNNTTIYLQITELKELSLSGSGNVRGKGDFYNNGKTKFRLSGSGNVEFNFGKIDETDIILSGSGNYAFEGTTQKNTVVISGSGNVDAIKIKSNEAKVSISGSGNVSVHAASTLDIVISGSGSVTYAGNPSVSKRVVGSGTVRKV